MFQQVYAQIKRAYPFPGKPCSSVQILNRSTLLLLCSLLLGLFLGCRLLRYNRLFSFFIRLGF